MEVRMADHMGMCFGVRDAIDLALRLTRQGPLTIMGDLVHNPDVLAQMDAAGAARAGKPGDVRTRALLLTAHGTADRVKLQLRQEGHQVHDATCPLVKRAHVALQRLVAEGCHPVVIGQADHVEVRGLVGDFDNYSIVLAEDDLSQLDTKLAADARLGVVAQTTQPLTLVLDLVAAMRRRWPAADIRFVDTVCQPTKDRQEAMQGLIADTDAVVVVGGPESNNSRKLTELAQRAGRPAFMVARASELRPEWFRGVRVVGVTAGTSTPEAAIQEVRAWLEAIASAECQPGMATTSDETMHANAPSPALASSR
jgi:4-hydroxy-3-methylbut-2-enyl diphosphate reductase